MSRSLHPAPPALAAAAAAISNKSNKKTTPSILALAPERQRAPNDIPIQRRTIMLGLTGTLMNLGFGEQNATAAARRPPPSSPEEKKDPNVSGVQAKVLASKKRKEAMKEAIAKLRERGKPVNGPTELP